MKLTVKLVYITVVLLLFGLVTHLRPKAESTFLEEANDIYNTEADYLIPLNEGVILKINKKCYYYNKEIKELEIDVKKAVEDEKYIYMICETSYIYKLNKATLKLTMQQIPIDVIYDIALLNDKIVVGGIYQNNLKVQILNAELKIQNDLYLESTGKAFCNKLVVTSDYIYVIGIKDAHIESKHFENVGNKNTTKAFIFKYTKDLKIIEKAYFNENKGSEYIEQIEVVDDGILIFLKGETSKILLLDDMLDIIKTQIPHHPSIILINAKKNDIIYLYYEDGEMRLFVNDKVVKYLEGNYLAKTLNKGILTIYHHYFGYTSTISLKEYHLDFSNSLICDYYNYDETTTDHFSFDSYFENLHFEIDNITPFFTKTMSGEYEVTYVAITKNQEKIYHKTPLIVKDFINIRNGGIYPQGMRLNFFGSATLNNEVIHSGATLSKEGENTLVITDVNGKIKEYKFMVVNGYYKEENIINMEADFTLEYGDTLYIKVKENVEKVLSGGVEVGKICKINEEKYLQITPTLPNITNYEIDEIELENGEKVKTGLNFKINLKKRIVEYAIYEQKIKNNLNLKIDIFDEFKNLDDVYLEIYQNEKLIKTIHSYILDKNDTINTLSKNDTFKLILKAKTEDQNEVILFMYEGLMKKKVPLRVSFSYLDDFKTLHFSINLVNSSLEHSKILLGNNSFNLSKKYTLYENRILVYVSIGLSLIVITFFTIFILKRKKAKKHYN